MDVEEAVTLAATRFHTDTDFHSKVEIVVIAALLTSKSSSTADMVFEAVQLALLLEQEGWPISLFNTEIVDDGS